MLTLNYRKYRPKLSSLQMLNFSSSQKNYPSLPQPAQNIIPSKSSNLADRRTFDSNEKKQSMRLALKKPINILINEGIMVKNPYQASSIFAEAKYGASKANYSPFRIIDPVSNIKNESSSTKTRIEELINDSKQLIYQGSKLLGFDKDLNKKLSNHSSSIKYEETPLEKTALKEFRRVEYFNDEEETPKKNDAYKEFNRLENKLKELEQKIDILKAKRIENSMTTKIYNPRTIEQKPYSKSLDQRVKSSLSYTNTFQNIVTQVQPHSILPTTSKLMNPKINEKFCKRPTSYKNNNFFFQTSDNHRYFIDSVIQSYMNPKSLNREIWIDHFWQTMQCINFVKGFELPPAHIIREKLITLSKRSIYWRKKTIIFDLDETLVHCNESPDMPCEALLTLKSDQEFEIVVGINVRPFARECLRELAKYFELIVFTASHDSYASSVLEYLDPNHEFIQHRLSRNSCILTNDGIFIKDLRVIGNRNIEEMLLVDNAAYSFGFQLDNGVPILPYYDDQTDTELLRLTDYLIGLAECQDIRKKNREYFKLEQYDEFKDPVDLLNTLFYARN